ncbi:MAG TPA: hypothetical protein PKO22_11725 [Treponemataceae bacterium]|nr:hypothetical protein [Treponemataceae bacterium]
MKKTLCALAIAFVAVVSSFAQVSSRDYLTVEGKLVVRDGVPYVVGGRESWVLPACPFYQFAWENDIRTGDMISVDGVLVQCNDNDFPNNMMMIVPAAMWVNGRQIELRTAKYFNSPQDMRRLDVRRRQQAEPRRQQAEPRRQEESIRQQEEPPRRVEQTPPRRVKKAQ